MFDRLVGLETEYALRFRPRKPGGQRVSNAELFARLIRHVGAKVPVASALPSEYGWFTANGGAVRLERNPFYSLVPSAGLVEGATPECRGPFQLLLYQRAQDALLSRAAAASGGADGDVALLKNNHDGHGNCHGSHENYEAIIASGAGLLCWRLGVALLLPVLTLLAIVAILAVLLLSVLLYAPVLFLNRRPRPGRDLPAWWEASVNALLCLSLLPVLLLGEALVRLTAFRRQRRRLLAFLVTRPVIAGAGIVGPDGRFGLSPRAAVIRSECGLASECFRPIFYFGHIIKGVLGALSGDLEGYLGLFRRRQRLQICAGDSNMAQPAEFLKIGTTLLVLEAIEAGELDDAPRLRRPLRALRAVCADPDLRVALPLAGGRRWTALQIQRFYLDACRRFLGRPGRAHPEAETILRLWEETLDALEQDPGQLVGKLDWVTKRYLLDSAGGDAPVPVRRKIDLRYHELSREGYYLRLEAAGVAPTLVEPEEVLRAAGVPPGRTPAAVRGRLVREFAASPEQVRAGWCSVVIRSGSYSRVVRLHRHGDG